jgi:GNAT superfamily N-acetyltransferase
MPYTATILTPSLITSHPTIIPSIARLHASCILIDGTLATYLPPLDPTILTTWWQARYAETLRSERIIIVIMTLASGPSLPIPMISDPVINALPSLIAGIVTLSTPFSETGPFRGTVEKLLICPSHRRLGLARLLMGKLETVALEHGKTILTLGTTQGTPAEKVYPRLGWKRVGVVERNGIHPLSGELIGEVLFWKDLNVHERVEMGKGQGEGARVEA